MNLSKVFRQIKFQTLVGWAAGYLAGIVFNVILGGKFDNRFGFLWAPFSSCASRLTWHSPPKTRVGRVEDELTINENVLPNTLK